MTAEQVFGIFLAHFVGDYILQSHWMATEKVKRWWPAIVHGATYTLPYLFVTQSPLALFVIFSTHVVIDRYRLAKYLSFAKNHLGPRSSWPEWETAKDNGGFNKETPTWLSMWLLFIADNTVHVLINAAAVVWL